MLVEPQFKYPESQQKRDRATGWKVIFKLGTGHYLSPGEEDLGLNKVKFTRSPL